jgi:hypothetical protein
MRPADGVMSRSGGGGPSGSDTAGSVAVTVIATVRVGHAPALSSTSAVTAGTDPIVHVNAGIGTPLRGVQRPRVSHCTLSPPGHARSRFPVSLPVMQSSRHCFVFRSQYEPHGQELSSPHDGSSQWPASTSQTVWRSRVRGQLGSFATLQVGLSHRLSPLTVIHCVPPGHGCSVPQGNRHSRPVQPRA